MGEQHGRHRRQREHDADIDRAGQGQRGEHDPLRETQSDGADERRLPPAPAQQVEHVAVVAGDQRHQNERRYQRAPEAECPRRHLGDADLDHNEDAARDHPRRNSGRVTGRVGMAVNVVPPCSPFGNRPDLDRHDATHRRHD